MTGDFYSEEFIGSKTVQQKIGTEDEGFIEGRKKHPSVMLASLPTAAGVNKYPWLLQRHLMPE